MAGNIFGEIFRLVTFGESHGPAMGGVLEGCPAGLMVDVDFIQAELSKRRPGILSSSSPRQEDDHVEILSGVYNGTSLGTPIAFAIRNKDQRPEEYQAMAGLFRPSHSDFTTEQKYGIRDPRGGGRGSGRETAARVVAGAIAKLFLKQQNITVTAFTCQIGPYALSKPVDKIHLEHISASPVCCPDEGLTSKMIEYLDILKNEGDTTGGAVGCVIQGVPAGLGEPVFDKLHADLGKAVLSIGACKGFEIGSGFSSAEMKGSEHNDPFVIDGGKVKTLTNHSGGVQGGISNGMDLWFRAAFKPVPSIHLAQQSIDSSNQKIDFTLGGRHDICVIPRVIPVVEAMVALVLADHLLRNHSSRMSPSSHKKNPSS